MASPRGTSVFSMDTSENSPLRTNQPKKWRNKVAYWLLGLCNNYGYVVMLSAAHDVLEKTENPEQGEDVTVRNGTARLCNTMSTGTILLADILPSLIIKVIAPFLPFFVHLRVLIVIVLSCAGFLLVAFTTAPWMAILGVVSTSFASGLGELTFLAYSHKFERSSISMWSSGTGGAGVFGAGSYAGLTALGLSSKHSLLLMLVVPVIMGLSFWFLLQHPERISCCINDRPLVTQEDSSVNDVQANDPVQCSADQSAVQTFFRKLRDIPPLFRYMIPIGLVYLFEYFINQGLFELIYFEGLSIDNKEQYRWFQLDYQIGVFISRSSASCFTLKKIWLMAVLQFLNIIIFTFEAIYFYMPSIWIVFTLILWEGTLGGAAYVNTYHRIANEVAPEKKEFALSITTLADAIGIGLAGAISIPVHNLICNMPAPDRLS